jgi:ribosomal protein L15
MGIGDGLIPPILNTNIYNDICIITDEEASKKIEVAVIEGKGSGKMVEINLDTICENFENGETVTLAALKEKRLVNSKAGRLKILARGRTTKTLTVCADKFSLQAVKMITLAGGTTAQYK